MKRKIMLFVVSLVLIAMCSGCNRTTTNTPPNNTASPTMLSTYTLLLYDNMLGGGGMDDTITVRASDRIMENNRLKNTKKLPNRTESIFGRTFTYTYDETLSSKTWSNNRDDFSFTDALTDEFSMVSFDSATGALRVYINGNAGCDRGYRSVVNDKSSEADFIAYAKNLVSQYFSVEGCEVEITTEIFEYDELDETYYPKMQIDGYVNNSENNLDFYAVYYFTFYKTIDGIRRFDTNVIEINNTGEVHRAWLDMQDGLYADFVDVDIDMEQAERLVKGALAKFIPMNSTVEIVPSVVATNDGNLWLHLETFVEYDGGTSGYIYVIQLSGTVEG